ncbi:protein kinase [Novymonas esmeraldas]|uniref:non-specific serine/threonine protein kinase n=1 Tax=Novymonas esmeraldas TaxID=1808958 RepID=A0AAW0F1T9_9TRYP
MATASARDAEVEPGPARSVYAVELGELIFQGAESKVYHCSFYGAPALCKHRFVKRYRNPNLDERLRSQRTHHEARALERCVKVGIRAPRLLGADYINTFLVMSYEAGPTVKEALDAEHTAASSSAPPPVATALLRGIGVVVARLHNANIVHGDLTTSNFICTCEALAASRVAGASGGDTAATVPATEAQGLPTADDLVVLDFGLISDKFSVEERAVDLYVLERAIASTHPYLAACASDAIVDGYRSAVDPKKGEETMRRLEAVRARGRKRSMVG